MKKILYIIAGIIAGAFVSSMSVYALSVYQVEQGGTGTSTAIANYLLIGNPAGTNWTEIATSSLGISGGGGFGGLGTTSPFTAGYITEATGTNVVLSNSNIFQSTAGLIGVSSTTPNFALSVTGTTSSTGLQDTSLANAILAVDAKGNLIATTTSSFLSGYVPYTGATNNVNLGSNALTLTGQFTANLASTTVLSDSGNFFVTGTSILASTTITSLEVATTTNNSYPLVVGTSTPGKGSAIFYSGIAPRTVGYNASTSITVNTDITDIATTTFSFATTTLNNPFGTPFDGQMWAIQGYATTSRAVAFGSIFATSTDVTTFPSAIASGTVQFLFQYRQAQGNWIILGQ